LTLSFEVSHKSPEAFRTISEVAEALDLPQHVLRFWETRFAHVHPLKRAGNRRYYRPEDIDLLRGIAKLLYAEGLTIKGVQKILREQGARYVGQVGRGETEFITPLKKSHLTAIRDNDYGLGDLAALHLEFAQQAEAIELSGPMLEDEEESNVRSLSLERARRRLTPEQRARLEELLAELLAMKARLMAAKARAYGEPRNDVDAITVLPVEVDPMAAPEAADTEGLAFSYAYAGEPYDAPPSVAPPAAEEPTAERSYDEPKLDAAADEIDPDDGLEAPTRHSAMG
jgi:DNA-binding transcriptional MerR regulator